MECCNRIANPSGVVIPKNLKSMMDPNLIKTEVKISMTSSKTFCRDWESMHWSVNQFPNNFLYASYRCGPADYLTAQFDRNGHELGARQCRQSGDMIFGKS
jgi:hypothetical protein